MSISSHPSAPLTVPRRRPGPRWGPFVVSAELRCNNLSNWAPAFAGEPSEGGTR